MRDWNGWVLGLVLGCGLAAVSASAVQAPQGAPDHSPQGAPDHSPAADAPPLPPGLYVGPASCGSSNCHGNVRPHLALNVRQDEYFTWLKRDPHARAYEGLFDERSAVIARNLRLGAAAEERLCLGCHSLAVPAQRQQRRLEIEDGISCESCHGPASGWLESHRAEGSTHAQSVAAGMSDLRDLDVRSSVCLSCHLGTAARTVDHELIAAGHPELFFELDNYSEGMPAHWFAWAERPDKAVRADTHGTPAWAVGQAVAFRAALDQLAGRARAAAATAATATAATAANTARAGDAAAHANELAPAASPGRRWPELAQLTCDSCHHSLAQQRWRTARSGEPGLPRWSQAHYVVLRTVAAAVTPERAAALDPEVEGLARLLARFDTPPAEVAASAERLSRAVGELVPKLAQARWDEAQARRLLIALSDEHGAQEGADYQSARQIVLAVQTLASQLVASDRRWLPAGLAASAESLSAIVQQPYDFDRAQLAAQLAGLRRQLQAGPAAAGKPAF
jgi:hypothetical protein